MVRVEQRNKTLVDMEVYDDGPYEVGDENLSNPDLVPVPANSYLGESKTTMWLSHLQHLFISSSFFLPCTNCQPCFALVLCCTVLCCVEGFRLLCSSKPNLHCKTVA